MTGWAAKQRSLRVVDAGAASDGYPMEDQRKRWIMLLPVAIVLVTVAWAAFLPNVVWDGDARVRIVVTVLDEETKRPIPTATVELRLPNLQEASGSMDPDFYNRLMVRRSTDANGSAELVHLFGAGGSIYPFFRTGYVDYASKWLVVSASGYSQRRLRLSDFTGKQRSIHRSQRTAITVSLSPLAQDKAEGNNK